MNCLSCGPIHGFEADYDDPQSQTETFGSVGVINVDGLLQRREDNLMQFTGGAAVEFIGQVFGTMLKNPRVSSIVLRFDSMGGDFQAVPEVAKRIYEARGRKPIIAHADGWMSGSAYWLASAAAKIVATPSSPGIGGLGFVTIHFDHSKLLEKEGIEVTLLSSSPRKTDANPYQPLSAEAKADIESKLAVWETWMASDISTYRGVGLNRVMQDFGQGRVMLSEDAKEAKLVDSIESFAELIARLGGTRR